MEGFVLLSDLAQDLAKSPEEVRTQARDLGIPLLPDLGLKPQEYWLTTDQVGRIIQAFQKQELNKGEAGDGGV